MPGLTTLLKIKKPLLLGLCTYGRILSQSFYTIYTPLSTADYIENGCLLANAPFPSRPFALNWPTRAKERKGKKGKWMRAWTTERPILLFYYSFLFFWGYTSLDVTCCLYFLLLRHTNGRTNKRQTHTCSIIL